MNHKAITPVAQNEWAQLLRSNDLRAITQRVRLLDFHHHHPHSDAENIFVGLRPNLTTLSLQAVHVIVQDLSKKGLIRRTSLPDANSARYETRIADNHHHIQCVQCGHIEDVDCVIGAAPCLDPSHTHGMRIIEANIVFRGICRTCDSSNPDEGKTHDV